MHTIAFYFWICLYAWYIHFKCVCIKIIIQVCWRSGNHIIIHKPTTVHYWHVYTTGLQLLISQYQVILQSLPVDYENTLNLLQNYLTDEQLCQILNSPNYNAANKVILDCLIEKFKESVDVSELCKKLELIASLSTSKQLSSIVRELKAG